MAAQCCKNTLHMSNVAHDPQSYPWNIEKDLKADESQSQSHNVHLDYNTLSPPRRERLAALRRDASEAPEPFRQRFKHAPVREDGRAKALSVERQPIDTILLLVPEE
jgi:hypothetical protein